MTRGNKRLCGNISCIVKVKEGAVRYVLSNSIVMGNLKIQKFVLTVRNAKFILVKVNALKFTTPKVNFRHYDYCQ